MSIDFYYNSLSSPCRAVMLTAEAVGLHLNKKCIRIQDGEHLKPEFIQINPQHTIPTIVDNGFTLWESRAILVYLATEYGKDDALYPNDAKKRGLVLQRLNFDLGLYQRFAEAYYPPMFMGYDTFEPEKLKRLTESLDILDLFLSQSQWAAGDHLTLADHSLVATVSTLDSVGIDLSGYQNLTRWYLQCQEAMAGYQEANQDGVDVFRRMANKLLVGKH